jgi:RimJ/RimL family protein N-acetyltransferase
MPLPVIQFHGTHNAADLIRLFLQTEARWTEHLAEPEPLDVGTTYANAELAEVYDANNVRDVALADGMTPAQAMAMVEVHYAEKKARCAYWTMNSSAPADQTRPMVDHLLEQGYRAIVSDVLALGYAPDGRIIEAPGIKIIPTRASFRHARELFEEIDRARAHPPACAEAKMLHLDDPHWDSLLALKDGRAAAHVGVLGAGEIGRIKQVMVAEPFRRQGIALAMMSRALEICARSLFRHVMISVSAANEPARRLYQKIGFKKVGGVTSYFAPWTNWNG